MRALFAAAALALATLGVGCSDSPCQELGEKLCGCTGVGSDTCEAQVEDQLDAVDVTEGTCERFLGTCRAPDGTDFCAWLLTEDGKKACGLAAP